MSGKTIARTKHIMDGEATTKGMGHIFKEILDEKEITVPRFVIMLSESEYHFIISEHMMYKILEDKVNFRSDYLGMFIDVVGADPADIVSRLVRYSLHSKEIGMLYEKKAYYPRKNKEAVKSI
mgnify:CR=1 FL=1